MRSGWPRQRKKPGRPSPPGDIPAPHGLIRRRCPEGCPSSSMRNQTSMPAEMLPHRLFNLILAGLKIANIPPALEDHLACFGQLLLVLLHVGPVMLQKFLRLPRALLQISVLPSRHEMRIITTSCPDRIRRSRSKSPTVRFTPPS